MSTQSPADNDAIAARDGMLIAAAAIRKENDELKAQLNRGFEIGQYTIRHMKSWDGKKAYWIEYESGEGMEVSADSLDALIADFYAENF